jgi:hypothetical protein
MIRIDNKNNHSKLKYSQPLIFVLSAVTGTEGMGTTPIFMFQKPNIGAESTTMFRSVS